MDNFDTLMEKTLGGPENKSQAEKQKPVADFDSLMDSVLNKPEPRKPNALTDSITNLGQGTLKLPGNVAGFGDVAAGLVGLDRPFSKAADYLGDKTGLKLTQMANDADKYLSPELKAANANIPQEGSAGDIARAYLHNPRAAMSEGIQSIPMMLGSGLIGKVAGLALPALADKAMARFALGDTALTAGDTMSNIDPNVDPRKASEASLADGVFTGAVDLVGGKLANKLGLENFGNLAAGGGFTRASKLPAATRILGGTALQSGEEAMQNPVDQIALNAAEGNQWDKGVNRALVGGVVAGSLMGAGSNIASPGTYVQPVLDKHNVSSSVFDQGEPRGILTGALDNAGMLNDAGQPDTTHDGDVSATQAPASETSPPNTQPGPASQASADAFNAKLDEYNRLHELSTDTPERIETNLITGAEYLVAASPKKPLSQKDAGIFKGLQNDPDIQSHFKGTNNAGNTANTTGATEIGAMEGADGNIGADSATDTTATTGRQPTNPTGGSLDSGATNTNADGADGEHGAGITASGDGVTGGPGQDNGAGAVKAQDDTEAPFEANGGGDAAAGKVGLDVGHATAENAPAQQSLQGADTFTAKPVEGYVPEGTATQPVAPSLGENGTPYGSAQRAADFITGNPALSHETHGVVSVPGGFGIAPKAEGSNPPNPTPLKPEEPNNEGQDNAPEALPAKQIKAAAEPDNPLAGIPVSGGKDSSLPESAWDGPQEIQADTKNGLETKQPILKSGDISKDGLDDDRRIIDLSRDDYLAQAKAAHDLANPGESLINNRRAHNAIEKNYPDKLRTAQEALRQYVDHSAQQAAESAQNDTPMPTEAQKQAGNSNASTDVSKEEPKADTSTAEMDDLKAQMGQAIGELASLLGGKHNLTEEEETKLLPIMSKIFRISAKMGYVKFKDAAGYVMQQIRELAGDHVADKLAIHNLQAGYINMGGNIRDTLDYDSISQIENDYGKSKETQPENNDDHRENNNTRAETNAGDNSGKAPAQPGVSDKQPQKHHQGGTQESDSGVRTGQGKPNATDTSQGQGNGLPGNEGLAGHGTDASNQPTIEQHDSADGSVPKYLGADNYSLIDKPNIALTPVERRDVNILATEILKKPIEVVTEDDKNILRQYTGNGGLDLETSKDKGEGIFNQHYSSYDTIKAMYGALMDAGVKMVNNLEPSVGSGNFIGMHPHANWTAVDIDKTNTEIVKRLYPDAKVFHESYETFRGKNYDLVISNVPFASFSSLAREHAGTIKPAFKAIHNFFFAQSVDKLKTGGVMAFMTSTGTMDGTGEGQRLRSHLVEQMDVIGAYRLPMGTQKANASTEVMIDVIFLQKRPEGVASKQPEKNHAFVDIANKDGHKINQYFVDYPESVLGELSIGANKTAMGKVGWIVTGKADYSKMKVEPQDYTSTEKRTDRANDFSNHDTAQAYADKHGYKFIDQETKPFFKDGIIYDIPVTYNEQTGGGLFGRKATGINAEKLAALQKIDETHDANLVHQYEEKYGKSPHTDKLLESYAKGNHAAQQLKSYLALFDKHFNLSEIFTKQVRFKDSGKIEVDEHSPLLDRAESLEDADGVIASKSNLVSTEEKQELLDSDDYAQLANGSLQSARLYYAGNIYKKLDDAAKVKPAVQRDKQIAKLEKVKPPLIPIKDISITGKESWLPDSAIASIGKKTYRDGAVIIGENAIADNYLLHLFNQYVNNEPLVAKGKDEMPEEYAERLKGVQNTLHNEVIPLIKQKLMDDGLADEVVDSYNRAKNFFAAPVFDGSSLKNLPETFKGKPFKLMLHQQEGVEQAIYNKKGVLAFSPGLGKTPTAIIVADQLLQKGVIKKPLFIVPANTIPQWEASTRSLYPNAKVYEFPKYASGINKGKPKEWQNMTAADKEKMVYDLTNNQYDYTFISTNLAQKFAVPTDKLSQYLDELTESVSGMEKPDEELNKSQLKVKESRLAKIRMLKATVMASYSDSISSGFDMGKMGFDALFADEVQYYKNIGMQSEDAKGGIGANVAINAKYPLGLDGKPDKEQSPLSVTLGSSRSYDFRFKTRFISENNNGNNVFLLTGTPTPNKPLELMTLLYHLDTKILDEYGINNVGDFVDEFLDVQDVEEMGVDGNNKMKPQLVGIKNVFGLKKIISRFIDYRSPESAKDLTRPKQIDKTHIILQNSDAESIFADIQKRILQAIEDAKAIMNGDKGVVVERMIKMYGAGRDASIDVRLYSPSKDDKGDIKPGTVFEKETRAKYSKIAKTVELVAAKIKQDPEAGQLIFLDRLKFADGSGSTHEDIRNDILSATGLEPQQVVFVNGGEYVNPTTGKIAKSIKPEMLQKIMDDYNAGKIKVLIGNTSKLGVGVDLQITTTDIYQIDKPYRPDEIEQRNNRGVRQGNRNSEVTVHTFNQPGTFDAMSDRIIANKQGFNDVFWKDQDSARADVKGEEAPGHYDAAIELEQDPIKKRKLEIERDLSQASGKTNQIEKQISSLAKRIRVATQNLDAYAASNEGIESRETPKYEDQPEAERKKSVAAFKKRMADQHALNVGRIADIKTDLVELEASKEARVSELDQHKAHIADIRGKYVVGGVVSLDAIKSSGDAKPTAIFNANGATTPIPKRKWLSDDVFSNEINRLMRQFSHDAPVYVRNTVRDVVDSDVNASGVTYKGGIYLFRDGIRNRAEVAATLWHELLHYGLRRFLTKDQYIATMTDLYSRDSYIKSKADSWINSKEGKELAEHETPDYVLARGVDEALAELAEEGTRGDYKKKGRMAIIIRRVIRWLSKKADEWGFNGVSAKLNAVNNDDARKLISNIFARLENNDPATDSDWAFTADPSFMGARDAIDSAKTAVSGMLNQKNKDWAIYNLQDKYIDLKRRMEKVVKDGGTITEAQDARVAEELYHKRLSTRTEDFLKDELNPVLKSLHESGIKMGQFEKFLHAKHAPSRNKVMAERNPSQDMIDEAIERYTNELDDLGDSDSEETDKERVRLENELSRWNRATPFKGGEEDRLALSGVSDGDAKAFIDGLEPSERTTLEALAKKVYAINDKTLDLQAEYGLETREKVDSLRNAWDNYVPLHRDEAHPDSYSHPIGRGFSVKGSSFRNATGSNAEVTNILAHVAMAREQALTRGEKTRVDNHLVNFLTAHPDPDFATVGAVPTVTTLVNGFAETNTDPSYRNKDNYVMVRQNGHDIGIEFNPGNESAVRLASALKNLDGADLDMVERLFSKGTRWVSAVNTQYNLVFGVMNLIRDAQGGLISLESTPIAGKQKEVMRSIFPAMQAIYGAERGTGNHPLANLYREYSLAGGTTGYRDLFTDVKDRQRAIRRAFDKNGDGRVHLALTATSKWLSDFNTAMENSVRLATYKAARDNGLSIDKSASLAKNITVNFNRKGAVTTKMGAFYAFFNASVQGTARMMETLNSPAGKKIMASGVALGAISAMVGIAAMGGDDWDKIPENVRERNLIIPNFAKKGDYFAVPMPLGFNLLPNIGRKTIEAAFGSNRIGKVQRYGDLLSSAIDTFNPWGGKDFANFISPTVADPVVALWRNKDWTGKTIYKEDFNSLKPTPGFTRAKNTATSVGKLVAEGINRATGGTDYKQGFWSPTPDQLDFIFGQLTGGTGRELMHSEEMAESWVNHEEMPMHKIPLVGKFYGEVTGNAAEYSLYYDNVKRLNAHHAEIKGLGMEPGGKGKVDQYLEDYPDARLVGNAIGAERVVDRLNTVKKRLVRINADKTKIRAIDDMIGVVMKKLNDKVLAQYH